MKNLRQAKGVSIPGEFQKEICMPVIVSATTGFPEHYYPQSTLLAAAQEESLVFVKGTDFLIEGGQNSLRLAYSGVTPDQIDEGVGRLAAAYRALAGTPA